MQVSRKIALGNPSTTCRRQNRARPANPHGALLYITSRWLWLTIFMRSKI